MWIKLATLGYCRKTLRRLPGKLAWADRPSRETSPHTSGPLAWVKYTPSKVLKALGQAIATTIGPWVANSRTVGEEVRMYVDAAEWKSTYMVGLWSDKAGARLCEAPVTVWNQQAAECREGGQNSGIPRHEAAELGSRQFGGSVGGLEQAIQNTPQRQGHDGAQAGSSRH